MTTADGTVLGTTKLVDHGPAWAKWNLVIVSEGYRANQMSQFHDDADGFVDVFFATAPFDDADLQCAINVYRIDVTSTDSGADDPNPCGNDTDGSGATPATYFDASYCWDGQIRRLLSADPTTVTGVVNAEVPEWDQVLVIVNSSEHGGAGGQLAVTAKGNNWENTAIHEIGHSAFGLADEYEYYEGCGSGETSQDTYTGSEPSQPNVTIESTLATIKWSGLVSAATPMPTTSNADCSQCDSQGNPVAAGTVGAFEGAKYFHCGLFRPVFDCKMRHSGEPFCGVCRQRIEQVLQPFIVGEAQLDTPTLTFNDVPEAETTVRAVTFSVSTCTDVTFEIVSGPTVLSGPPGTTFTTPLGTTATMSPTGPVDPVRLWIGYTGTSDGDIATGTVRVRWVETGDEWDVPITANTIARPTVAVVLVLDQSGSMTFDAGDGRTRVEVLRDSAVPFVDLIHEDNAIGVVAFDQDPHPVMDVKPVGPLVFGMGRGEARAAVLAHTPNPAGSTAIGDGVEIAHDKLTPVTGYDAKALIVLTDGQETDAKYIADVMPLINERVYAIGLGTAEQIQPAALTALTNGTGGFLRMTGTINSDDYFQLAKYYLQILAGVTNADIVLDPEAYIAPGQKHLIPFRLNETDIGDDVILLSRAPEVLEFLLEAPDGTIVDPGLANATPGMSYAQGGNTSFYRAIFPLPLGGGSVSEGIWTAILSVNEQRFKRYVSSLENDQEAIQEAIAHGVRYSLSVHAFSNLRFTARIDQDSHEPGAVMTVTAVLTEYGLPVDHRATVDAEIERPNGTTATLGMVEVDPGVFELSIIASMSGIYQFQLRANGTTLRGRPFTREQGLSGVTWRGGDGDLPTSDSDGDDGLCTWLRCLFESGAISDEFIARLRELGIDIGALRKCLERHCERGESGRSTLAGTGDIGVPEEVLNHIRRLVTR
jgi:hypothetical protein